MKSRYSISSRSGGLRMFNDRGKRKIGHHMYAGGQQCAESHDM